MANVSRKDIQHQVSYYRDVAVSYGNEAIRRGLKSHVDTIKIIMMELTTPNVLNTGHLNDKEWSFEIKRLLNKVDDLLAILRTYAISYSDFSSLSKENQLLHERDAFLLTDENMTELLNTSKAVEELLANIQRYRVTYKSNKNRRKLIYALFNAFVIAIFLINGNLTSLFVRMSLLFMIIISYLLILSYIFERRTSNG